MSWGWFDGFGWRLWAGALLGASLLAAGITLLLLLTHRGGGRLLPLNEALLRMTYLQARRVVVLVVGSSVLLLGVAMIVLPGPAVVVIPMGLAILAAEFEWARRLLRKARDGLLAVKRELKKGPGK